MGGHPIAELVQRNGRGHRHVERVGAVGAQRDPGAHVAASGNSRRQALALCSKADDDGRLDSRPRPAAAAPRSSAIRVPWELAARAGGRAKIEPMLARTAFGEYGSAQSGPRTTGPSQSAWAERMTAPTLPGSCTPWR